MPKAKSVLVYTMTPELARELKELRRCVLDTGFSIEYVFVQARMVVEALDAQAVTTPAEKRRAKR